MKTQCGEEDGQLRRAEPSLSLSLPRIAIACHSTIAAGSLPFWRMFAYSSSAAIAL